MFIGTASTILILPPSAIVREDGTLVKVEASSSVRKELESFIKVLKDKRILLLLPMFFASNYFYAYQGAVNAFYFDGPTRASLSIYSLSFLIIELQLILVLYSGALNGALEGAGAIVGALMVGFFVLDGTRFRRRTRGFLGLAFVALVTTVVWSCALAWQVKFNRNPRTKLHYTEKAYHAKGALFFFCTSSFFESAPHPADKVTWQSSLAMRRTRLSRTGSWAPSRTTRSPSRASLAFTRLSSRRAERARSAWTLPRRHS